MDNTHKTKRAVDKATAFTKWCGKDLKYPALLFLLMTVSSHDSCSRTIFWEMS